MKPRRNPTEKLLDTVLAKYLAGDGAMSQEQCVDAVRFLMKYVGTSEEKRA
jgi:hypothetical protein